MNISVPEALRSGAAWVIRHRERLFLLAGMLLVGVLAFESGFLRGILVQTEPLVISIPLVAEPQAVDQSAPSDSAKNSGEERTSSPDAAQEKKACLFVGSRNSDKYHLSSCAVVKRIKPENKVCFASEEDAKKRGYVAGCVK